MRLGRCSVGIGDRFGREGVALLRAFAMAREAGADVVPVWNKSEREHANLGTAPAAVREEADRAVRALEWSGPYHVDADHIRLADVDRYVSASDYFTIDVAGSLREAAPGSEIAAFQERYRKYRGPLVVHGIDEPFLVTEALLGEIAGRYLAAAREAGRIYRTIEAAKGREDFVVEVSMDEADVCQSPLELFFVLGALADEGVPLQAIAPRFCGRFKKGVDYEGNVERFSREVEEHMCVLAHAAREFGLPENLKLSVHSGSDKFSLYGPLRNALRRRGAGLHVKTAGTTWLEELAGLAESGGEGLRIAKEIYRTAFARREDLCRPYGGLVDVDPRALPAPDAVDSWPAEEFVAALEHDRSCPKYRRDFRQLLHVAYKVAAEMGERFLRALEERESLVAPRVTRNIYERHIRPLFVGEPRPPAPGPQRGDSGAASSGSS